MSAIVKKNFDDEGRVFTLSGALSPDECADFIRRAESQGFQEAPITVGANKFMMAPDIRNNRRLIVDDTKLAGFLFGRVKDHVPATLGGYAATGLNERLRYYRYDPGQQFDWHRDGSFVRSPSEQSLLTLMFYLNDDFEGGTTDFQFVRDEAFGVAPQTGMALAFSHPVYHRGAPVLRGNKYVLRTDVMYSKA